MEINDFLSKLNKVKKTSDNHWIACCPAHNDTKPSLCVSIDNGKILLKCHTGCTAEEIVSTLGLEMKDLFDDNNRIVESKTETGKREHIYKDEANNTVAKKSIVSYSDGSKKCAWYRYENNQYYYGLNGVKVPLYRLPELVASSDTVYIVEGEKDTETMEKMGYTATSSPNGAGSKWSIKLYNPYLKHRDIILIADNDEAGKKAVQEIAIALSPVAKSLKIIPSKSILPSLKKKGDISDIVGEIGIDEAKRLLDETVRKHQI